MQFQRLPIVSLPHGNGETEPGSQEQGYPVILSVVHGRAAVRGAGMPLRGLLLVSVSIVACRPDYRNQSYA